MRLTRVPRSGGMILSMLTALIAIGLLPFVFMAALIQSAEAHPRPIGETLRALAAPVGAAIGKVTDYFR